MSTHATDEWSLTHSREARGRGGCSRAGLVVATVAVLNVGTGKRCHRCGWRVQLFVGLGGHVPVYFVSVAVCRESTVYQQHDMLAVQCAPRGITGSP